MNRPPRHSVHTAWHWIPPLFVAEELPAVLVFYVAAILFVQLHMGYTATTLLSALLLLPWALRSFARAKVRKTAQYRLWLLVSQFCMFLSVGASAFAVNTSSPHRPYLTVACLLAMSVSCAWHSLLSSMYYERMFYPREQRYHMPTRHAAGTAALVLTYGILIMLVGFLQIFFRHIPRAWAMGLYLVAGGLLVCLVLNLLLLRSPRVYSEHEASTLADAVRREWSVFQRLVRRPHSGMVIATVCLLLLPQAFMFYPRVFFLLGNEAEGGLDCSLQDVGFAQGAIGVLAFSAGTVLGRYFMQHSSLQSLLLPLGVTLTLSPLFYLLMSLFPQRDNNFALCLMTGAAQFCFGLGLNVCRPFVRFFSADRYRGDLSLLTVPLVVVCMVVPVGLSGALVDWLGLRGFFVANALTVPLGCMVLLYTRRGLLRIFSTKPKNYVKTT